MPDVAPFLEHGPVLSTPDTRILDETTPVVDPSAVPERNEEQLIVIYEIERTVTEIKAGRWKRIALQFPDHMLVDAPRVALALSRGLRAAAGKRVPRQQNHDKEAKTEPDGESLRDETPERVFILADTSYGACCVDEVAAEHANAEVVVHYGRSCLSPTTRLPAIYIFTVAPLDFDRASEEFKAIYRDHDRKVILMADLPFQAHLERFASALRSQGYTDIFVTSVIHQTTSPLPNRTIPPQAAQDVERLGEWALFHLSQPSPSLLLNLAFKVSSIHFFPGEMATGASEASSSMILRRRYGLLTSLSTAPIFGILINTLSVRNYMSILKHVKEVIAAAGKKSYTFVVGKVNAAKMANFGEIGGWVVIGCWESSLFESKEFWKPVITPFELEVALQRDDERVWTGKWNSDFQALLDKAPTQRRENTATVGETDRDNEGDVSEEESAPPEFDLRTGRYVSQSRPMMARGARAEAGGTIKHDGEEASTTTGSALATRPKGDLMQMGSAVSPAADFFREKRTWQGLGSDFEAESQASGGAAMEQGRHGIARGYRVGEEALTKESR